MKNRIYISIIIISLLIGCNYTNNSHSSIEDEMEICLGEDKASLFDLLVESFEDFLVRNHYASDYTNIPEGIGRYIDDVRLGIVPIDSLIHDKKKNSELAKKLTELGFLKKENGEFMSYSDLINIEFLFYNLSGSPFFDQYSEFLPCLKTTNSNTNDFINYYLQQKDKYGALNIVIFAHDLQSGNGTKKYESKIVKEIIIVELYIGILLNNIEKSSAPNSK